MLIWRSKISKVFLIVFILFSLSIVCFWWKGGLSLLLKSEDYPFASYGQLYVSDRPDLTGDIEANDVAKTKNRVYRYFQQMGMPLSSIKDLHIATSVNPSGVLLFRCELTPVLLKHFVSNKKKLNGQFEQYLYSLYGDSSNLGAKVLGLGAYSQFLKDKKLPYSRLDWWPPTKADYKYITIYEGNLQWEVADVRIGTEYYIFVNRKTNEMYILGW